MDDYTMRSVYSEVNFIFKAVIYAIKGIFEQKHILQNITGLFNSTLFAYFNLMLGSFAGIEREKRLVEEVLAFPYVYSDVIAKQVEHIQGLFNNAGFQISEDVSEQINKLNEIVLETYHLANNEFVDYALHIQIPQLTDASNGEIYRFVETHDLESYSKLFFDYLSTVFARSEKYVLVNVYPQIVKHYSAVEIILQDKQPQEWLQIINDGDSIKEALTKFSAYRINDLFFELKDVIHFQENSFYIIKPSHYKNWHPAIARLDLMDVVDQILSRNEGDI
jgi:hypothetical protein